MNDRVSMDWNEDFVTLAMNSNAVVEVFELVAWRKLHEDVLTDTRWNHTLLVVLDLEEGR